MLNFIRTKQFADNWGDLRKDDPKLSLPTNVDGANLHVTERGMHFLFLEVKRGEGFKLDDGTPSSSGGQSDLLLGMSYIPENTVVIVHSVYVPEDVKLNTRDVVPEFIQEVRDGVYGPMVETNPDDFRHLYTKWIKSQARVYPNMQRQVFERNMRMGNRSPRFIV